VEKARGQVDKGQTKFGSYLTRWQQSDFGIT